MTAALGIDVFADIVCPWCYIGLTRLEKVLSESALDANVSHHLFFLSHGVPDEGLVIADDLRRKYGADPIRLFRMAEAAARESGMNLDSGVWVSLSRL